MAEKTCTCVAIREHFDHEKPDTVDGHHGDCPSHDVTRERPEPCAGVSNGMLPACSLSGLPRRSWCLVCRAATQEQS